MTAPAYRTISDVSVLVGVPHHVLRFWEAKFPAIAPLKRGGNRRYYRPDDVAVIERIARLLYVEGYTIRGVQKLLEADAGSAVPMPAVAASPAPGGITAAATAAIRADLATALAAARAM